MKFLRNLVIASAIFAALPAQAQITAFKHIVIIVQENRTPDNLFAAMCQQLGGSAPCDPRDLSTYDIQTSAWKTLNSGTVTPVAVDLGIGWDIEHHHNNDWVNMCDLNQSMTACQMDGAANETCLPYGTLGCSTDTNHPEFTYVQRYNGGLDVLGPYIDIALTYGWANLMFETNQGPSFPAHQFIYGATSAPLVNSTENDDLNGIYAAENAKGCLDDQQVKTIILGDEDNMTKTFPCFTHLTLGTMLLSLNPPVKWRYYTPFAPNAPNLWTAPEGILSECGGSNEGGGYPSCTGPEFTNVSPTNVVPDPRKVLTDIASCHLQSVSWVIPDGQYSDHASIDTDLGPQWVAAIVNTIGASTCQDSGKTYWQDTAIIITWDDWGGWYDHEPPKLNTTQYYQLGFRVPLLFVSAYGQHGTNGNCIGYIRGTGTNKGEVLDFGSIANFIEHNFGVTEGYLGFADARAVTRGQQNNWPEDLSDFYNITTQSDCPFVPIPTQIGFGADYFINDTSTPLPPDDE